jgi:hypothetical protein
MVGVDVGEWLAGLMSMYLMMHFLSTSTECVSGSGGGGARREELIFWLRV